MQQSTTHLGLLVGDDDPLATHRRRQRRGETRRAGTDHQYVAVGVGVLVAVGIGVGRGPAETGCGAN